ncbi:MAG: YajG family lipoprotein [Desulfovibrionales bacterium]
MRIRSCFLMILFILVGLMAAACAPKNKIPLEYQVVSAPGSSCTQPVSVIAFGDDRNTEVIGEHGQDILLFPGQSVPQWVSWALFDELENAGCGVRFHDRAETAISDFAITGTVNKLYVSRTDSRFEYQAQMSLTMILKHQGRELMTKQYMGSVSKVGTPTTETYRDILEETLREILQQAIPDMIAAMRTRG